MALCPLAIDSSFLFFRDLFCLFPDSSFFRAFSDGESQFFFFVKKDFSSEKETDGQAAGLPLHTIGFLPIEEFHRVFIPELVFPGFFLFFRHVFPKVAFQDRLAPRYVAG